MSNSSATDFRIRVMQADDYSQVSAICALVYPTERPYTDLELQEHHARFPEGQFVAVHTPSGRVAGAHFTLMLQLRLFHLDDSWDTFTAQGSFTDHDPSGHTLYGADLFVHPEFQHHGLGKHLTESARALVRTKNLWRMTGGSRLPGYGKVAANMSAQEYVQRVRAAQLTDPVLTAHIHDGWDPVTAVQGYLPHDAESAGWAAVIQWINPACPPPADFAVDRIARKHA